MLARREGVELIGLTSPRNADFVEGLGIYDRTVAYDEIDSLDGGPATFVDIAGDGEVRLRGPLALRRRARPQHGGGGHPLGGARGRRGRAARAHAGLLLRPRPGDQARRGLGPRRPRDPRGRRLAPVLRVDRAAGWRRSAATASRPCATPTSTCSRAASAPTAPTCSPSPRRRPFQPQMTFYVLEHVKSPTRAHA